MMMSVRVMSMVLVSVILLQINISGQNSATNDLYITAAYRHGFVLPEYSLFYYLLDDYVHSFALSISKQSSGKNEWHQVYNYPEYGIALQYATLGNRKIFGHELSLFPFAVIHIKDLGKFSLMNHIGLGVGIADKKYDVETNPYNVAIGSTVNLHFNFELNAQYQVRQKLFLYTGLCMDHFSNGNFGEPNLGINYLTFNAGLRYLTREKSERTRYQLPKYIPTTQTSFILSAGSKHARSLQSRSYFISSFSFELKRKLCRIFYPGIGADIFYDGATHTEVQAFGEQEYKNIDDFKTGVHIAQEFVYNKFSVSIQEGIFLGLTDKAFNNSMYNRFVVRHFVSDHFFLQMAMKSHVGVLDFIEFGFGYSGKA